jgi:RNA-binding protein MEX3
MPASLLYEMEHSSITTNSSNGNALEDRRALQLALELSMLGLDNDNESTINSNFESSDNRNKKSQNTTECVPVPSSEHVAEIVGRQGMTLTTL